MAVTPDIADVTCLKCRAILEHRAVKDPSIRVELDKTPRRMPRRLKHEAGECPNKCREGWLWSDGLGGANNQQYPCSWPGHTCTPSPPAVCEHGCSHGTLFKPIDQGPGKDPYLCPLHGQS